jgi:anaerobic magnesium-protoporphyrin IX monomethyl ester cyclase
MILDIFPGTALYTDYQTRSGIIDDIWLKKVEDILYLETDPRLSSELVLAFGKKLRTTFHEHLPDFAEALELIDTQELYPGHADFLSRLAMTFTHGEYAGIDAIQGKARVAERLFRKALTYHPDHRAYLGLGMLMQRKKANEASVKILSEGTRFFPLSESLNTCLGMSYMKLGQYEKALSCFLKFPDSKEAARYIAACREAMGHPAADPHLS